MPLSVLQAFARQQQRLEEEAAGLLKRLEKSSNGFLTAGKVSWGLVSIQEYCQ